MDTQLTQATGLAQLTSSQREALASIPEESKWLANFTSAATRKAYREAVVGFIAFAGLSSFDELRDTDPAHVIAWRDQLMESGASPRSINQRLSALSSLFKHLCQCQLVAINPVDGVKRPKINQRRVETPTITPTQVRMMLDYPMEQLSFKASDKAVLKAYRDTAILYVLFYTGCRASEVTRLKLRDYYQDSGNQVLDFIVKGGKRNSLAIHQEAQIAIRRYLAECDHAGEPEAPLFLETRQPELRRHLSYQTVQQLFKRVVRGVALDEKVSPHTARATFITEALSNRCPLEQVQESVAHADISTTRMYDKRTLKRGDSASFRVHF